MQNAVPGILAIIGLVLMAVSIWCAITGGRRYFQGRYEEAADRLMLYVFLSSVVMLLRKALDVFWP